MKVLIADKFQEAYIDDLYNLGHEIIFEPSLTAEELPSKISGFDVLIVRSTKVTKETIAASDALSLIIRAGAGVNTIDIAAAAKKGIFVSNTPGKNSIAVAELVIGLIIALDRNIAANTEDLKKGKWNKKKYTKADGLFGKKLGIIGLGEIGLEVAKRAKAFGIDIVAYDPIAFQNMNLKTQNAIEQRILTFTQIREELIRTSDIITIHVPSNPHTINMVNKDFLEYMKPNSILINTSRGDIVVDEDLIEAMNSKNIKAGLDVFNNECESDTGNFKTPLSIHPNVIGTHHIGASTEQAQNAIAEEVIRILEQYEKGFVLNAVNIQVKPKSRYVLVTRMYDKVGSLECILRIIKENGINIEKLESMPFVGEAAQYMSIYLDKIPDSDIIKEIKNKECIIHAELKTINLNK